MQSRAFSFFSNQARRAASSSAALIETSAREAGRSRGGREQPNAKLAGAVADSRIKSIEKVIGARGRDTVGPADLWDGMWSPANP